MTLENIGVLAVIACAVLSPVFYAAYVERLENRPGGADDRHKHRIVELCAVLRREPPRPEELETLSVKDARRLLWELERAARIERWKV